MQDLDGSTFQNFKFLIQTRIPGFEEGKGERRRKRNKGEGGQGVLTVFSSNGALLLAPAHQVDRKGRSP